jgi:hypothetical protein
MRLVLSLLICCACGASNATARRFGGEAIDCPEQDVEATMLVHDVFEVVGCDRTVVVHCSDREVCEAVEPGTVPEPPRSVGTDVAARSSGSAADQRRADSGEALGSPRSGPASTRTDQPGAQESR